MLTVVGGGWNARTKVAKIKALFNAELTAF